MRNTHAFSMVIGILLICYPLFGKDYLPDYQYVTFNEDIGMVEILPPLIPEAIIEKLAEKYTFQCDPCSAKHFEIPISENLVPEKIKSIDELSVVTDDGFFKMKLKSFALRKIPDTDEKKFLLILDNHQSKSSYGITSVFGFLHPNARLISKNILELPGINYFRIIRRTITELIKSETTLSEDHLDRLSFQLYSFPYTDKKNEILAVGAAGESDSDEKIYYHSISFLGVIDYSGSLQNVIFPPSDFFWYEVKSFCDLNGDGFQEVLITDNVGYNDRNVVLVYWNQIENKFEEQHIASIFVNEVY